MKALVATKQSQGARKRDFWRGCVEGELVRPIEERCVDSGVRDCSCETAFLGLASGGLTTTAVVADLPRLTLRHYTDLLGGSLSRRERTFVVPAPYAGELVRVARGLRGTGVVERWDEWIGFRFDDAGDLNADLVTIAEIDPAELEDLG